MDLNDFKNKYIEYDDDRIATELEIEDELSKKVFLCTVNITCHGIEIYLAQGNICITKDIIRKVEKIVGYQVEEIYTEDNKIVLLIQFQELED
jgi:hypothetical protein